MTTIFISIAVFYVIFISALYVAYAKVKAFTLKSKNVTSRFSIVVPFRNEANHLEALLQSFKTLNYPKDLFEIILIDDDSVDDSVEIIQSFLEENQHDKLNISIIKNKKRSPSPKKDAIATAISHANFEWIVTTDADCVVPKSWLLSFDAFIQHKTPKLMVAPVGYKTSKSILDYFQLHDFLSLQTATVGGFGIGNPFLCNGANLCYSKTVFKELNGFEGNTNIASGDDLFFMEKVAKHYPQDLHFLKSKKAIVYTSPEATLKALFYQRVRWASKTSAYNNLFSKTLALIVLLMNASLVVCFVFSILGLQSWSFLSFLFMIKFCIDFVFIFRSSNFYNQNLSLLHYPLNSLMYPFFVVAVSCYSMFFNYKWKGRSFKK
jgi:cellulose synthase/poly-beta-1,6-N-acetylglucosamine synthase-like glycosyltransferase